MIKKDLNNAITEKMLFIARSTSDQAILKGDCFASLAMTGKTFSVFSINKLFIRRRGWDSNPRSNIVGVRFSRAVPSATRSPLHKAETRLLLLIILPFCRRIAAATPSTLLLLYLLVNASSKLLATASCSPWEIRWQASGRLGGNYNALSS